MQPIQDKDFDKLFNNAFSEAEIAPSRNLWPEIESELQVKKSRKLPFLWLTAAVVLIVASLSLLFYNTQNKDQVLVAKLPNKASKPVTEIPVTATNTNTIIRSNTEIVNEVKIKGKPAVVLVNNTKHKVLNQETVKINELLEVKQPEVYIAKVEEPKQDLNKKIEEVINQKPETVMANITPINVETDTTQDENKGIRNVGDLVNMVVNKVDKRKNKFIQFRTDDDDSSLASINIGPFKFGKKSRK